MYSEYDCFVLTKKIPNDTFVDVGKCGVVLMVLSNFPPIYEVEFVDNEGRNIGDTTYALSEEYMSPLLSEG